MADSVRANFDGQAYLTDVRRLVLEQIRGFVPPHTRYQRELYDLVLSYPLRPAKGLRPALCVAACRALGGGLQAALPTAAVLELYHNAFLVHDDVEDISEQRRGEPTLHSEHGAPIAVNVGDAMLALCLKPLLDNTRLIGLGPALQVLQAISEMATHSAEGQALELYWIRHQQTQITEAQYLEMVEKKTAHYSFVAPLRCGALIAGSDESVVRRLTGFARSLGVAFQIQDDLLNLSQSADGYGKEPYGDLWEGKYTLVLIAAMGRADADELTEITAILAKPRQAESGAKTPQDVQRLMQLIDKYECIPHAAEVARAWTRDAAERFEDIALSLPESTHRDFLKWLVDYTVERAR